MFPAGGGFGEEVLDIHEGAVEAHGFVGLVVGGGEFKFEGEISLFFLEVGDEFFHLADGFFKVALVDEGGFAPLVFGFFLFAGFEEFDGFGGFGRDNFADPGVR